MSNDQNRLERIEDKIDKEVAGGIAVIGTGGAVSIAPTSMGELMEYAKMMSLGGVALRKEFRGNPGTCLMLATQALRWGMDPFAVALKAYVVNDQVAYEAQLVNAVVNMRAPLRGRLRPEYTGEGGDRQCTVRGLLAGEDETLDYASPRFADIPIKNSPLWKNDPDQQLWYYSVRAWARRHVPEVLLGVYTGEEIEAGENRLGPENATDVTPPRPQREDYVETFELYDENGEEVSTSVSAADYTDMLIVELQQPGANVPAIWAANETGIDLLERDHREGCYEPLFEVYEKAIEWGVDDAVGAEAPEGAKTGDGAPDEAEGQDGASEDDATSSAGDEWRMPSIILTEDEEGANDWETFFAAILAAINGAPTVEAVDAILELHGPSVEEMRESGRAAAASKVTRAAETRRAEVGTS